MGEREDDRRINALNLANLPDIDRLIGVAWCAHQQFPSSNQPTVLAGKTNSTTTCGVDQLNDFLIDLPGQHHFNNVHGFGISHSHPLDKLAFFSNAAQQLLDLRTAAVHNHGVNTNKFE